MALHVRRATGLSLAILAVFFLARPAQGLAAEFEIAPGGFSARLLNAAGEPEQRSGAHPDRLAIDFALSLGETTARDIDFELPPGLGMSANAVPGCPRATVEAGEECPADSQVGTLGIVLSGGSESVLPLFELEGVPGQPASIGTKPSFRLPVTTELRPGDFGITVRVDDLPQEPLSEGHLVLWGVPGDHQEGTSIERRALLSTPSTCGPLSFGLQVRSWEEEAPWLSASSETAALSGCAGLPFEPGIDLRLSDPVADSPTGLALKLSTPGESDPSEVAQAQIRELSVALPAGIGFSPGGVAALSACSEAQLGLGNGAEARCPPSSKVGAIEMVSPAIDGALAGSIYLGQERPGQRFRVFIVVNAVGGVLKFVAGLGTEAATGRLLVALRDLPPIPIDSLAISFDGGRSALLASPLSCGTADALAQVTPYGGGAVTETTLGLGIAPVPPATNCAPAAFSPQLSTAASSYRAGRSGTFAAVVRRGQGEQLPGRLSLSLPAGLGARLGAVQACGQKETALAACPPSSRTGSVLARIGSGLSTATLPGGVFLTGPYGRAPFGLAIEIPAEIGSFDLGTITLRGSAQVDSRSGRLTVRTDPLPASVEGLPVRFQSIELDMDRPGLIRNPTSCAASATDAALESQAGATIELHSPFRARGCRRLAFKPVIGMDLTGASQLHRHGRPGMRMGVRLRSRDANLRTLSISLPSALEFGTGGLREICSRRDAIGGRCPSGSRIGRTRASSPLLAGSLSGAIFIAQPRGDGLPDIWTKLSGGGVTVNLRGRVLNKDGKPEIELAGLPDISLTSLEIRLAGGARGPISLATRPCVDGEQRKLGAATTAEGQNGAQRALELPIGYRAHCGPNAR